MLRIKILVLLLSLSIIEGGNTLLEISDEIYKGWMSEFLNEPNKFTPIMILMFYTECTFGKCPEFSRDFNVVAGIVKDQGRFTMTDCGQGNEVCAVIPKPNENEGGIIVVYITDEKVY